MSAAALLYGQRPGVWQPMGPANGTVFALTADPFDSNRLFAGAYFGGLYRSTDQGATWTALFTPFGSRTVLAVALDPSAQGAIYVSTFQAGIYKSTNDGVSWEGVNQGLTDLTVQTLAIDPSNPQNLLAGTGSGLFVSTDAGGTWQLAQAYNQLLHVPVNVVVFHPTRQGVAYLGTPGGVMRSADSGQTWFNWSGRIPPVWVNTLTFDPGGTAVYAATRTGAFRLTEDSGVWQDITGSLPAVEVSHIVQFDATAVYAATGLGIYVDTGDGWSLRNPLGARYLYPLGSGSQFLAASLHAGLQVTSDAGQTFAASQSGMQNLFIGAMSAAAVESKAVIYAGSDTGVYTLSQDSPDWNNNQRLNQTIFDLQGDPQLAQVIYAGTEKTGVWKSADFGQTWQQIANGITPAGISTLVAAPDASGVVYAASDSGLYLSRDDGRSWVNAAPIGQLVSAAVDPARPGVAAFGTAAGQVFRTSDGGNTVLSTGPGLPQQAIAALKYGQAGKLFAITAGGDLFFSTNDGGVWSRVQRNENDAASALDVSPTTPFVAYLGTRQGGLYRTKNGGLTWTLKNQGLASSRVNVVLVDPGNPSIVYAGTPDGVFKTVDGGDSWALAAQGLTPGEVTALVAADSATLYVSITDHGVFKSVDAGQTWKPAKDGAPTSGLIPIGISRASGSVFLAARANGIFVSRDGGATWAPSSHGLSLFVRGIAVNPRNPNVLYAGSLTSGLFKTIDGGQTWTSMSLQDKVIFKIGINSKDPNVVLAATSEGLLRSSDGGTSFQNTTPYMSFAFSLAADPRDRRIVYFGGAGGLFYKTLDAGTTWIFANAGLPVANVNAVAVDPIHDVVYAALERSGLYRSSDGGYSWVQTAQVSPFSDYIVTAIAVDEGNGTAFVSTAGGGLFRSTDTGKSWQRMGHGLTNLDVTTVFIGRGSAPSLYAGAGGAGLLVSADGGATWLRAGDGLDGRTIFAVDQSALHPELLYAATDAGLYRSEDAGATWAAVGGSVSGVPLVSVVLDPVNTDLVYALNRSGALYRSNDGGASWIAAPTGYTRSVLHQIVRGPVFSGVIYGASYGEGILASQDRGATWSNQGSPGLFQPSALSIAVNPKTPAVIYLGTAGTGVLRSVDGGLTWAATSAGLDHFSVLAIAVDPSNPDTVYAGTVLGGVFASDDAGLNWKPLRIGMFNTNITSLTVDPITRAVYAGTEGGGVFRLVR